MMKVIAMRPGRHQRALAFALLLAAAVGALLLLLPASADAQCAMCKTAVQAGGEQTARTMRSAMLVLLVPSVALFCSIFVVFMKYGKTPRGREGARGEEDDG
jgi:hypothetical protein